MTIALEAPPRRQTRLHHARSRALAYLPASALLLDIIGIAITGIIAIVGRNFILSSDQSVSAASLIEVGPLMLLAWLGVIAVMGGYQRDVFGVGPEEFKRVLNATFLTASVVGVGCYLAKFQLSRGFFLLAFVLGGPALLLGRALLRRALHQARSRGALRNRVLIAGIPSHVDELAAVLERETWLGYEVVGAVTPAGHVADSTQRGIQVVGNTDDVVLLSEVTEADVVVFAGGAFKSSQNLRQTAWEFENRHVQMVVAPSLTDVSRERVQVRPVGGVPLLHVGAPRSVAASRWAKRTFDLVGSGFLILLFVPLIAFTALSVKLHDGGAVFFRQTRVGKDGKEFGCFKFRTMVMNAEAMVAQMQEQQGTESAVFFKMKDDPRITKPGKWLRRYSVDELPQLFNVFNGDMSLIGPRPQVPREVAEYDDTMRRRLRVRPGMTGLWQVSGRNDLTLEESIRLDTYYVDNWSMVQDLSILARTVNAVFASRGAY